MEAVPIPASQKLYECAKHLSRLHRSIAIDLARLAAQSPAVEKDLYLVDSANHQRLCVHFDRFFPREGGVISPEQDGAHILCGLKHETNEEVRRALVYNLSELGAIYELLSQASNERSLRFRNIAAKCFAAISRQLRHHTLN